MGGDIIGSEEDVRRIHNKIRALNSAPAPDNLENAEALFDMLEKVAGRNRHRSAAVFWGGYIVGSLCTSAVWWYF